MVNTIFCFFLYQRLTAMRTGRILTETFLNDRLFIVRENAREHTARLELLAFNSSTTCWERIRRIGYSWCCQSGTDSSTQNADLGHWFGVPVLIHIDTSSGPGCSSTIQSNHCSSDRFFSFSRSQWPSYPKVVHDQLQRWSDFSIWTVVEFGAAISSRIAGELPGTAETEKGDWSWRQWRQDRLYWLVDSQWGKCQRIKILRIGRHGI